jgi:hypothetical protein
MKFNYPSIKHNQIRDVEENLVNSDTYAKTIGFVTVSNNQIPRQQPTKQRSVTDGFHRLDRVTRYAASIEKLLSRRPELSDLVGICASDRDFQDLCSDTIFLLDSIEAAESQRAKLGLLQLLHKLNAEIDDFLIRADHP